MDRYSEDVDIAIIYKEYQTENVIKTIIRNIQKEITTDLKEKEIQGITSKDSSFRRSVFEYIAIVKNNSKNKLLVEINSLANPFPFQAKIITSMVSEFLIHKKHEKFIDEYELHPFEMNVLSKEKNFNRKTGVADLIFIFGKFIGSNFR
ncbi:nucleotidyl transferase AbiEii/AbiGii toxin family protein [Thermaurantimonas aggregans]|uniref:nucleotidyl transferase AbiEii/AbiGii toxin family protein n=1 Tax=Thermaurantimonas aggregans TaxID=2173829 RepID=UPI000F564503|nr:nucleotidyl transferase AbiEii/AbiGii toxin family protein [Thermaurantimonas aggregans]MCX8147975.1 nucleotidyl transferase AbiEii/AbiGii toxin family protein [Thermaurantimonas aggregans]